MKRLLTGSYVALYAPNLAQTGAVSYVLDREQLVSTSKII